MTLHIPTNLAVELQKESPDYEFVKNEIVSWFNKSNGQVFPPYDQLSDDQRYDVVVWLSKNYADFAEFLFTKKPTLHPQFHITMSKKISTIAQHHCPFCTDTFPMSTIPIVLPPHSYQSTNAKLKRAFLKAILYRFQEMPPGSHYLGKKVCLHVVFVMAKSRKDKDVDNMAKLLLDGLKDVLFSDDKEIVHLSVVKIQQQDPEEYIYVNIRESNLPNNENVFSEKLHHSFAVPVLDLKDFLEDVDNR